MRHAAIRRPQDAGMSLVEVVVAVVILGAFSAAVLGVILQTQSAGVNNRARVAAANLAARELDIVRDEFTRTDTGPLDIAAEGTQTNPHPLDGQVAGQPMRVDGMQYTLVRQSAWNVTGPGVSACSGGSLVTHPTLSVTVSVTWPRMGSVKPVVTTATLAPAKGKGLPGTASFVAVKVVDAAGQPNPGRDITVTGGSETVSGTTDSTGCAVVQVNPASGAGTTYTAKATDAGYVDISGTTGPVKNVGQLARGRLSSSVSFAYDRAGTVRLNLVDPSGAPIDPTAVAGATVSLLASESSGGSSATSRTVTGTTTVVNGLWPTQYGAYFGTTPPPGGFGSGKLLPGGTLDLEVPLELASGTLLNLPDGTTGVVAAPASAASCTGVGARGVDPAGFAVMPGSWSFYATGATFDCAPGPAAVPLAAGGNDGTEWLPTTLRVTNAPAGGRLWAVNRSKIPGATLTSCPSAAYAPVAVDVDAARTGPVTIPAGDWYVFRTDGGADGSCLGTPTGQYSKVLAYGTDVTLAWLAPSAALRVTGVPTDVTPRYSTSAVLPTSSTATTTYLALTAGTPAGTFTTAAVAPGTYYVYGCKGSGTPRCALGGRVLVGGQMEYTFAYNPTTPPVVGP